MRVTIEFDDDTAAAVDQLRQDEGLGLSEAVNELIRRGLLLRAEPVPYKQRTERLGIRIDVSNVAEALETLDGPEAR
jgi:hypothetical protein